MNNELLSQALAYLHSGFSIIPVKGNKKPFVPSWKKFQVCLPTEVEVRSWFKKYPVKSIAILTGAISGIAVVDVEKEGNIDDLPKTVMAKTGGGGWHFYYKYDPNHPIRNHGRIRDLTDIRGDGGYIIAPPSLHLSGKRYEWQVPLKRDELAEFPYWIIGTPSSTSSQSSQCSETIDSSVLQGKRNGMATKVAGKILHDLDKTKGETDGWPAFQEWNSKTCKPPLDNQELRTVWNSISQSEIQKRFNRSYGKKDKQPVTEIYSKQLRDGRIIEAYYDAINEETGLLVFEDGKAKKVPQLNIDNTIFEAPPPSHNLIKPGFIKLPSDVSYYESELSLINEIKAFIHAYVEIPSDYEDIAAFYVLFSWVFDHFQELPYLRAIGDFGSGKSRFLKVIGALCYRPIFLNGSASVSAIFRIIHEVKGTLILDEADFRMSDTSSEIVKILNSGFQKGMPVFRSEATGKKMKSYDPTPFDVFCPKVIATRKDFYDDALESRCLSNSMETLTRNDIPETLEGDFEDGALKIRNKLVMFRFQKLSGGISKEPLPKLDIEPRLRQIISPLYRVVSDPDGKNILLEYIKNKQQKVIERRFESFEGELLQSILKAQENNIEPTMKEIAEAYNEDFSCKGKYEIKPKKVGSVLEQIFHLEKRKSAQGIYLCNNESNEQRIKKLKTKFGIEKPEVNIVNNVNIPAEPMVLTVEKALDVFGGEVVEDKNNPPGTVPQKLSACGSPSGL